MNYSSYPPPKGRNTIIDVHKGQEELIDRQRETMKFRAPILVPVFSTSQQKTSLKGRLLHHDSTQNEASTIYYTNVMHSNGYWLKGKEIIARHMIVKGKKD